MIPEGVRGNKRRKEDQFELMKEIRTLLPVKSDYEIMKILAIPNSTYYRYKSKIYSEDKELWSKAMFEPLESRALTIYNILHESFRINKKIADNENNKPMERLKACKRMVNDQYNILYLLRIGPNSARYYEYM
jgi:hypothetical protein